MVHELDVSAWVGIWAFDILVEDIYVNQLNYV